MKGLHPIKLFTDNAIAARLWFLVALLLLAYVAIQPFFIIEACKSKERVVVLDSTGTYSISPLIEFEEARDFHETACVQSTQALLSINPEGYDYPRLLERIYLREAHKKAQNELKKVEDEIRGKNIHQKQEIQKIKILETRNNAIFGEVKGEIIRSGLFEKRNFVEALPFKLNLILYRNPHIMSNKRYPLVVFDYELTIEEDMT